MSNPYASQVVGATLRIAFCARLFEWGDASSLRAFVCLTMETPKIRLLEPLCPLAILPFRVT